MYLISIAHDRCESVMRERDANDFGGGGGGGVII